MRYLTLLLCLCLATAARAGEQVSVELVLMADSTWSIDRAEMAYERQGYATAITHPAVLDAIMGSGTGKIAVTYVEWGDQRYQEVIAPWTIIASRQDAERFAAMILSETGRPAHGQNAIGAALMFGRELIRNNDIDSARQVIDISGDSARSHGAPSLADARRQVLREGITINGLTLPCGRCTRKAAASERLERHYREEIIGGSGAFVVTVNDMATFAAALRRKLVLEVSGRVPDARVAAVR